MALKSKFESSGIGRTISESSLPKFDLPKFEPSRFNRLKQELTPPRFDLPKFESNGPEPATSQSISATREWPQIELNWFSLLHRRVTWTKVGGTKLRPPKSNHTPATVELSENEQHPAGSSNKMATWPEVAPPRPESGERNRLKGESTRPKFDLPKLHEPDGADAQETSQK